MKKIDWIKENKKSVIIVAFILLHFIIISCIYYKEAVIENRVSQVKIISNITDNLPQQQLKENEIVTQNFIISQKFDGIQLKLSTSTEQLSGKLHVELLHVGEQRTIASWEDSVNSFHAYNEYNFPLEKKEMVSDTTEYAIRLWVNGTQGEGSVFCYHSNEDGYPEGTSYINGVEQDTDVIFTVYELQENRFPFIKYIYLFMTIILLLVFALTSYLTFIKTIKIEKIFLVIVISLGFLYMIIMPPFTSCFRSG